MDPSLRFMETGGEIAALMRGKDWSDSPLGPPKAWPQALRTTVGLLLASKFPMFVAWGPELGFLYNDAYAEILGKKHPDALGRRFQDIWAEIWHDVGPLAERALAGEATFLEDLPLLMHRKGFDEQTWFTFSYSPVFDTDGSIGGMYCACTETTASVLASSQREREIERLRLMFQQAPGVVAILRGPQHVFEIANDAYLQLVGGRDVVGRRVLEALPEVQGQGFVELLDEVYRSGQPYHGRAVPVRLERKAGTGLQERFVDFIYQPLRDESGQVTGIFVEGSDVTEAQAAKEALQDANQRKDEFLAMLAHELRNPLAPISTAAHLLRLTAHDDPRVLRASDVISRQVGHMVALVDDLLDVSRVTRGLVELQRERLDVASVVAHAIEQARPLMEARGHVLEVEPTLTPLHVVGDRTRLTQVVANLLNNAAKYTPAGGRIQLRTQARDDTLVLSVEDNGIGIEASLLPHVFTLFTQATRTPERAQGGLGIGLALARSLVELHGGSLEAFSEGLDAGARFVATLPLAPETPDAHAPRSGAAASAPGQCRVMVVDDNADGARMLADILEAMGHAVTVCSDAEAALREATAHRHDALILDIGMPKMDGYELARRLRTRDGPCADALLIALTGYGQPQDRERSRAAGFDAHLVKPADPVALGGLLAQARRDT